MPFSSLDDDLSAHLDLVSRQKKENKHSTWTGKLVLVYAWSQVAQVANLTDNFIVTTFKGLHGLQSCI